MNDTELLDWLEKMARSGACPGIIYDDNGHWAVSFSGTQELPEEEDNPQDLWTCFLVDEHEWKPSIREAIKAAYQEWEEQ